jgi:hypothetical protein
MIWASPARQSRGHAYTAPKSRSKATITADSALAILRVMGRSPLTYAEQGLIIAVHEGGQSYGRATPKER